MSGNVSMCKRARLDADAAPTPPAAAAADDDDPLAFALSWEAFVEADTNNDGKLDRAEFLELAAEGLCPSAAAALAGRFGAADADSSGNLDPAEFHAALVAVGVPAAEVREWLDLRRSGDRVLVPHGEEGQQPGAGFRVTAAELELFETVRAMAEEVPRAVRYAASLSEPDLRGCLALFREPAAGGANFAAAADLGALARAVAACDFLGAGALPAAAMVWARLLPGAEAAAAEEAKEAFLCVVEQTSFGPALWAAGPLETVGRLAGSDGQEEQGDEHVRAVAGMALAELGRRILGMPDPELAMLRAHAAAPVAGLAQAELRRRYPQLAPMTDATIQEAVLAFCEEGGGREKATFLHSPNAEARYGPVAAWDVSGVQNMSYLFSCCESFNADVSAWDVSRVQDMDWLFRGCHSFTADVSAWDVSGVRNMDGLFYECRSFSADVSGWDVAAATNMRCLFHSCTRFAANLSAWRVGADSYTDCMFGGADAFDRKGAPWAKPNAFNA